MWLGKISYSLFLVHFPILVFVSTVALYFGLNSPAEAVMLLGTAVLLSLAAATVLHHWVEVPAGHLARLLDAYIHPRTPKVSVSY